MNADYPEEQASSGGSLIWNVLTVLVWLGMACMVMAFISVYSDPQSLANPLRPPQPTLVSAVVIPTMTASPEPTATLEPGQITLTPTETATPVPPTATASPSPTFTETATPGPSPTATIYSLYPFILRGEVKTIAGSTFPEHDTCKLWVAGQAYDLQGAPMVGITLMLGGNLDYKTLYQLSLTGTALQYGPAGFEFTVAEKPVNSNQAVWVQLFDQAMIPLSSRVYFDTVEDCDRNLILLNFRQVH
jgi:hypothetical protein